jgi:UDP-3-O-[3-hydroxymyristoyl] glucosamine N-acyltransferase
MPKIQSRDGITLQEIASLLNAQIHGDPAVRIIEIAALEEATPRSLCFTREQHTDRVSLDVQRIPGALLVPRALMGDLSRIPCPLLMVDDPLRSLIQLIPRFYEPRVPSIGISPRAEIDPTAELGPGCSVGAFCVIGADVVIEERVTLHPHVTIYPGACIGAGATIHSGAIIREECVVGADAIVQNGAVIGADGFGYIPGDRGLIPVPQIGSVVLEAHVEVGANTCIDRATLGTTRVGSGTKIDNQVQIGHNVRIGEHSVICGQVGIAGSARLGRGVVIGGNAGIKDHVSVADGVRVAAKAGVITDLTARGDYAGFPAIPAATWRRQAHALQKLPEIVKQWLRREKKSEVSD